MSPNIIPILSASHISITNGFEITKISNPQVISNQLRIAANRSTLFFIKDHIFFSNIFLKNMTRKISNEAQKITQIRIMIQ